MWLASGDASLIRPRVGYFTKPKTNEREDRKKNPDNGRGSLNAELENWKNVEQQVSWKLAQHEICSFFQPRKFCKSKKEEEEKICKIL